MPQDKTPLILHLGMRGWDMITIMQDLLTGKKRVPAC